MCQYEDTVQPYFKVTKALYKRLLAVRKHDETQKVEVVIDVYEIKSMRSSEKASPSLFPNRSPYSFCYVCGLSPHTPAYSRTDSVY